MNEREEDSKTERSQPTTGTKGTKQTSRVRASRGTVFVWRGPNIITDAPQEEKIRHWGTFTREQKAKGANSGEQQNEIEFLNDQGRKKRVRLASLFKSTQIKNP